MTPREQAIQLIDELAEKNNDLATALQGTIVPCLLTAALAALPVFIEKIAECLHQNTGPDAYAPRQDTRCQ